MEYNEKCLTDSSGESAYFSAGADHYGSSVYDASSEYRIVFIHFAGMDSAGAGADYMAEQLSVPALLS